MKRLIILGGNYFQKTAIIRAKELGYYVISVDYLPNNPGHKYSDEYHNVSTVDKETVLKLAESLGVDGILAYASDVSAPTAAYVSEKLNLPTNPYYAVKVLTNKGLFRTFVKENGMETTGKSKTFFDIDLARRYALECNYPVMVKPVDSSGSKGVTQVLAEKDFDRAFKEALSYSISKQVIVEEFISKQGYQIDGDGFVCNGVITNFCVMDQHNNLDRNPYAPIGLSYPSIQPMQYQVEAYRLIQAIFNKLNMRFGAFNFEYIIGKDNKVYLLEIGPRNGGNYIPDTILYATGVDMISAAIKACVGDDYGSYLLPTRNRVATSYVVHSMQSGRYRGVRIAPIVSDKVKKQEMFVNEGDYVEAFRNGGDSIGCMVLGYDSIPEMNSYMDQMWHHIIVDTDN